MTLVDLSSLQTEGRNPRTTNIDQVSTLELCRLINDEDAAVVPAVKECLADIARAIDAMAERVRNGGRVIYVGAGTSGRLGVVDSSEIPPTFSASHGQFIALMAGGDAAMRVAQEGAEDNMNAAETDLGPLNLDSQLDSLIGIAASGRTPYVMGCLAYAKKRECVTIGVACCRPSAMEASGLVDCMISPVSGPEVVAGSTRMKAGTATKLVLNMLSTGVMIKIGKTYGNMMVDLKASNLKLQQRSRNIIKKLSGFSCPSTDEEIDDILRRCDGSVKLALATLAIGSTVDDARRQLEAAGGKLTEVLKHKSQQRFKTDGGNVTPPGNTPLVMYVDGGGTKCAAVVLGQDGKIGKGEAGPCNATDVGLDTSISSIKLAAQNALDSFSSSNDIAPCLNLQSADFVSVWVGIAGYDRPEVKARMDPSLSSLFNIPLESGKLKISNDIDVLASAASDGNVGDVSHKTTVVLIAGTGSVAMSYSRGDQDPKEEVIRIGRSGGWGHLLGDDGGGFCLGREAIRKALYELDALRIANLNSPLSNESVRSVTPLSKKILEHFNIPANSSDLHKSNLDLLSTVLADTGSNDSSPKSKISQVARLVLEHDPNCFMSNEIINTGISGLICTLSPLLHSSTMPSSLNPASTTLVLSGSLLSNENSRYRDALLGELTRNGINFGDVKVVKSPALTGANALARKVFGNSGFIC
ncbi:N-acetylmuramic acid 6-phosphate etherase [Helicocarpus griseus UAMH5409]|uniref:N-acetyl-D-glucosamine kinase n=1 Tax=Helicocarpus griseus UAMH5409 TaxID=1447875 RepID=A0A2B7WX36_9EURO|nr:N-acetylmuramic acid 6-phosphate etherase [Helicocarpus griseus UAMH5409]